MFSEEKEREIKEIIGHYPEKEKRSALIPLLHFSQDEFGHISEDIMVYLAKLLELSPAQVYETATFYTMFNLKPVGRYLIQVCRNLSCSLLGAESLIDYLKERLSIDVGETTPDGMFTLKTVECLAACGTAPVIQINNDYYENLDKEKVEEILERLSQNGGGDK